MFKVNNKDIGVVLVSLLLTLNLHHTCSSVTIVHFEHVIAKWQILAAITCSKLTIETLEQSVKYVQS